MVRVRLPIQLLKRSSENYNPPKNLLPQHNRPNQSRLNHKLQLLLQPHLLALSQSMQNRSTQLLKRSSENYNPPKNLLPNQNRLNHKLQLLSQHQRNQQLQPHLLALSQTLSRLLKTRLL
jgi:hypothetical protein